MEIQASPQLDPELPNLPSLMIDRILSDVPVDDRLDADEAFDKPFTESLKEGLAWYLTKRGVPIVETDADVRVAGNITHYEGNKGWGDWGVEIELELSFFNASTLLMSESIRSHLSYSDDEDVEDQEKPRYAARGQRVSFLRVLFTRVGIDLSEKLISRLKETGPSLTGQAQSTDSTGTRASGAASSISIDSSIPHSEVLIDGSVVGTTPLPELTLPPGKHMLEIRKEGYVTWVREIRVLEGARSRFFAELLGEDAKK